MASRFSRSHRVPGIQRMYRPFSAIKLFMGPAFDEAALLQHQDAAGILYGGEAVRNHKGGPARHRTVHALLRQSLRAGGDGGGRLVRHRHRRVGDGRPGNRKKPALALAEPSPVSMVWQPSGSLRNKKTDRTGEEKPCPVCFLIPVWRVRPPASGFAGPAFPVPFG